MPNPNGELLDISLATRITKKDQVLGLGLFKNGLSNVFTRKLVIAANTCVYAPIKEKETLLSIPIFIVTHFRDLVRPAYIISSRFVDIQL